MAPSSRSGAAPTTEPEPTGVRGIVLAPSTPRMKSRPDRRRDGSERGVWSSRLKVSSTRAQATPENTLLYHDGDVAVNGAGMRKRRTLASERVLAGVGLHSGVPVRARLRPAPAGR